MGIKVYRGIQRVVEGLTDGFIEGSRVGRGVPAGCLWDSTL